MTWEMNYLFTNVTITEPFILIGTCNVKAPYCRVEVPATERLSGNCWLGGQ